ncbi:MAG: thioredoxin domain-containing protein, partial [Chloroflexi bacterium]|nr:thioredoxin domain-containing protein [Chloroflexota bacterium]
TTLTGLAGDLGLDTTAFETCLSSGRYYDEVVADAVAAQQYGFQGTPGFIINGVVYAFGAQSFERFDEIIQDELAAGGMPVVDAAPVEPAEPSAANWMEGAPGQYLYAPNPQTPAIIVVDHTTVEAFAANAEMTLPPADAAFPLLDLLEQAQGQLTGQANSLGLVWSPEDAFDGPAVELIGNVPVARMRLQLGPQFDANGQFFPGIDISWALIDQADGGLAVVLYQYQGEASPVIFADFEAWLVANAAALADTETG